MNNNLSQCQSQQVLQKYIADTHKLEVKFISGTIFKSKQLYF